MFFTTTEAMLCTFKYSPLALVPISESVVPYSNKAKVWRQL